MSDTLKKELTYITSLLGGLVMLIGNLLPYLTPATLAALGVSAPWCQRISIAVGLLLIVYRKTPPSQGNENAQVTPASPPVVPPTA